MILEILWTLFLLWVGFLGICAVVAIVRKGIQDDRKQAARAKAQRAATKARDAARVAAYEARQQNARGEV